MTAESIGADQVWAGSEGLPGADGRRRRGGRHRLGHRFRARRAEEARHSPRIDFTGGDGTRPRTATGRTWRRSSPGSGTHRRTPRDYRGIAPGAFIVNLRVLGADGSG